MFADPESNLPHVVHQPEPDPQETTAGTATHFISNNNNNYQEQEMSSSNNDNKKNDEQELQKQDHTNNNATPTVAIDVNHNNKPLIAVVSASKELLRSLVRLILQCGILPFALISVPLVVAAVIQIANPPPDLVTGSGPYQEVLCSYPNEATYVIFVFSAIILLMWLIEFIYLFATASFSSAGETSSHKDLLAGLLLATQICLCVITAFLGTNSISIVVNQLFTLLLGLVANHSSSSCSSFFCCSFNAFQWLQLPAACVGLILASLRIAPSCGLDAASSIWVAVEWINLIIIIFTGLFAARLYSVMNLVEGEDEVVATEHIINNNNHNNNTTAAIQQESHHDGGASATAAAGGGGGNSTRITNDA